MPSRKRQQQIIPEKPPDTTLLTRVTLPGVQKESPPPTPAQDQAPTRPREAREGAKIPTEEYLPKPPAHTLRRSLFQQVKKQPQNSRLWVLLGWSSPDARSAAIYFRRALEINPENPVALDGLKWALAEIVHLEVVQAELSAFPIAEPGIRGRTSQAETVATEERGSRPRVQDFRWRTISRFYQIPFLRHLSIAVAYLLLISLAEIVTVLVDPTMGIILHATIMIGLIVQGSIIQQGPFRRYLVILSLAPLIRLLSLSLPLAAFDIPIMYRYMIVGVPLLLAAYFAARSVGLAANRLYFTWKGWPYQLLFSLIGFILGYAEYQILHPVALVPSSSWFDIAMGMFILFVFTGFLEEFIFRSLLQVTGIQLFGGIAIWIISILFGILHIGYYSAFDVFFAFSVGLFFGYFALKTHSLLGVSLAHGITNITLYILLPLMLH